MRALFQRFPSIVGLGRGAGADMLQQRDERIKTYLYLRTKYRELQQQFTILRNRYSLIKCAWCKRRIGWKHKQSSIPGDTSHGICPSCATDLFRKIQAIKHSPDNDVEKAGNFDRVLVPTQPHKKRYITLRF
jgi:hypothetical protein